MGLCLIKTANIDVDKTVHTELLMLCLVLAPDWRSGTFYGVRTLRHQETSAPRQFGTKQLVPKCPDTSAPDFFGAELSHGHFGLVPNCLGAEVS